VEPGKVDGGHIGISYEAPEGSCVLYRYNQSNGGAFWSVEHAQSPLLNNITYNSPCLYKLGNVKGLYYSGFLPDHTSRTFIPLYPIDTDGENGNVFGADEMRSSGVFEGITYPVMPLVKSSGGWSMR